MKQSASQIQQYFSNIPDLKTVSLFPGIEIAYLSFTDITNFTIWHNISDHIMIINYCKIGRIYWKVDNSNYTYLGAGDFSIHTIKEPSNTNFQLPVEKYEGLTILINLKTFTNNLPKMLVDTGIDGSTLYNKLCKKHTIVSFAGNVKTDAIFQFFFNQSDKTQLAYQKIKVLELLLYLHNASNLSHRCISKHQVEQIEVVRNVHNLLLENLDKRITIEALSKQYLMNPTTLKSLFKLVYGTSIAAHMKKHRMQKAAKLLLESNMNIAEIALKVGYDSQSKFSKAFKNYYQILPKEYRKKH